MENVLDDSHFVGATRSAACKNQSAVHAPGRCNIGTALALHVGMSLKRFRKNVGTVSSQATVQEACRLMKERGIGAVVVVSDDLRPVGILTDRDVAVRVVAQGWPAESTRVCEVMTSKVVFAQETTSIERACADMAQQGVRRLPIVDEEGRVMGLVTLDDIVLMLGMELGEAAKAVFAGIQAGGPEQRA
jgi:CBS domain-containing protein